MAIVNRAWMMGDASVDREGNPVDLPAPAQSETEAYSIGSREWADAPNTEENRQLFQRWLKGEDVHPITDFNPAPVAETKPAVEEKPVEKKKRYGIISRTTGDELEAWVVCGVSVVLSVVAALGADMGSSGFIEKLLFAAALLVGAFIATGLIVLVGGLVYRILLGVDGIDVETPNKWRLAVCITLFIVLLAFMM